MGHPFATGDPPSGTGGCAGPATAARSVQEVQVEESVLLHDGSRGPDTCTVCNKRGPSTFADVGQAEACQCPRCICGDLLVATNAGSECLPCGHVFHSDCLNRSWSSSGKSKEKKACPRGCNDENNCFQERGSALSDDGNSTSTSD